MTGTRDDVDGEMVLLLNPRAGDGSGPDASMLRAAAEERRVRVVELGEEDDLQELAHRHAQQATALGMAGGDGSLGCVAAEAMRADIPFVCIPFGTRNHFALDLGLDRDDPLGALDAFVDRRERVVDVGLVGDRVVLNNVTFGVYAEVVHSDAYRDAKISESTRITREMLRGDRAPEAVTLVDPDGVEHHSPFALVIANNRYDMNIGRSGFGRRESLDEGVLEVSIVDADSGWDLASLIWSAATSETSDHDSFTQWTTELLELVATEPSIRAGLDGEAVTLDAPVEVRLLASSLRVLVPNMSMMVKRRDLARALLDVATEGQG